MIDARIKSLYLEAWAKPLKRSGPLFQELQYMDCCASDNCNTFLVC